MAATDWSGIAAVIAAIGVATTGVIGAGVTAYVRILNEVKKNTAATYTVNGKQVGTLVGEAESRRIAELPPAFRTESEREHLLDIPLPVRPHGNGGEFDRRQATES